MKYLARPNSVSYVANEDAQTAGRLCHCDVTKRRLYTRVNFSQRIRGSVLSIVKWMRWAMNPSRRIHLYMQPVLYHCDEVDCLFAFLFAIRLTEIGRTVSAFHLPLNYISRGYNPSLIQFFLGSLYPVHIKRRIL